VSEYRDGFGKYTASMTYAEFKREWSDGDDANIPFNFQYGNLWIFQPRKEVVYSINIINSHRHKKKLKEIVAKGLKELKKISELE
jgi:hypothetical protein